ncbi:hypothetical protein Tco_0057847 [Tanacetum coccineum]
MVKKTKVNVQVMVHGLRYGLHDVKVTSMGCYKNRLQILQSIDQGPFELGTTRDALGTTPEGGVLLGPERPRTYEDLSDTEKKRYDADDNVKMLLAGSELTKEDRESQLYDEFERFKMLPGENINEYYFVNNMSPEWDRFVTTVKLNKGLKETNHEQLYAYLKQHEKHAAQDRLIIERITPATNDQLAFMSTTQGNQSGFFQGKPSVIIKSMEVGHIARNCTQPKRLQNSDYFKDKMLLMQAQENGAVLDEEELLFLAGEHGNTFYADVDNNSVRLSSERR